MRFLLPLLLLITLCTCRRAQPVEFDYPTPVDTRTVPIQLHEPRDWTFGDVTFDTRFAASRLNDVTQIAPDSFCVLIAAENQPINKSPWYAFRLTSATTDSLHLEFAYEGSPYHRYHPKLSTNGTTWTRADSAAITRLPATQSIRLSLGLTTGQPLYVAAQDVISAARTEQRTDSILLASPRVKKSVIGTSKRGRDIPRYHLRDTLRSDKLPTIVILSRQHPPEVTGYLALEHFLAGIVTDPRLDRLLANYQFLIYPLVNPDGVDLGHWRHNAGGIDLNRDWTNYLQPEVKAVTDDVFNHNWKVRAPIVLGLDFHSTNEDVFYTHIDEVEPDNNFPGFKDRWLAALERGIGGDYDLNEEAEPIGKPTSMSWFRVQFGAEGITYEVGDDTPRDFLARKGRVAARTLIDELLMRP